MGRWWGKEYAPARFREGHPCRRGQQPVRSMSLPGRDAYHVGFVLAGVGEVVWRAHSFHLNLVYGVNMQGEVVFMSRHKSILTAGSRHCRVPGRGEKGRLSDDSTLVVSGTAAT